MTAPVPRSEREWQRRRQEILAAATRLFTTLGYGGTTMQAIAEEAEFSVGYLYRHFPGKEELLREIMAEHFELMRGIRREVRNDPAFTPLEAVRHELILVCEHLNDYPGLLAIFRSSDGIESELKDQLCSEFRREDEHQLRKAMELGEIEHGDPVLLAAAFDGVFWGLVQLIQDSGRPERYLQIPGIVDELILAPLERKAPRDPNPTRKSR